MAYRKLKPGDPMYAMVAANKEQGRWVCDAATHNSPNGCRNPDCFKYVKPKRKGKK